MKFGLFGAVWSVFAILACAHGPREHPKDAFKIHNLRVVLSSNVTVQANTTTFYQQHQPVEITWSGVYRPSKNDMIAIYVPADANPHYTLPIQFANVTEADSGHLSTGNGSAVLKLQNMRGSFRIAFVKGGVVRPIIIGQSAPIYNRISYRPTGGHLALHTDERSMVVQWISGSAFAQEVAWSPASDNDDDERQDEEEDEDRPYRWIASSSTDTYKASQMCGYPANSTGWIHPGYIHTAVIPSNTLQPGARYRYRYGSDSAGWSREASFIAPVGPGGMPATTTTRKTTTAYTSSALNGGMKHNKQRGALSSRALKSTAAAGTSETGLPQADQAEQQQPFIFLAFNDVAMTQPLLFNNPWAGGLNFAEHYGENSSLLTNHFNTGAESGAHLALMVGDLAYAMGYAAEWDMFGDQFERAFTQWPVAVGTGNHERDWPGTGDAFDDTARDSGGECNVPFTYRWYTPANIAKDPRTSYYSFRQGPVQFLILDSESPSHPGSPQGQFVASALASVDRSVTPWVVVSMHRMMVAPATWRRKWVGDVDVMERLQQDYEDLFRQHQVDVVISGHEHAYARTCPMYKGTCTGVSLDDVAVTEHQQHQHQHQHQHQYRHQPDSRQTMNEHPSWSFKTAWQSIKSFVTRAASSLSSVRCEHEHRAHSVHDSRKAAAAASDELRTAQSQPQQSGSQEVSSSVSRPAGRRVWQAPAGGPVYMLAGHAGAGFTWGFPDALPDWTVVGIQGQNGFLRFKVTRRTLRMEAVASNDGSLMDHMELRRG